jgi:glutathione S-transferase
LRSATARTYPAQPLYPPFSIAAFDYGGAMSAQPSLTLHVLPPSHPCKTVEVALALKGLEYERIELASGVHNEQMEAIYGEGNRTVPGLLVDGEPVHGSRAILARLEELAPSPTLYPEAIGAQVREAERWGDDELQDLGRRLPWGAMHFRPEAMGTFGGGPGPLDPAGTDFAISFTRAAWKYHGISGERLAADLAGLPAKLDHIDELAGGGILDGAEPNAADLQIGATARVLLNVGDLGPLLSGRAAERIARRWFPEYPGLIPAGAFPAGWVPSA